MNKEAQSPLVLDHASVLDVIKGELIPDRRVTLEQGRIARIESAHTPITDTEAKHVIDLDGKTLMPDCADRVCAYSHYGYGGETRHRSGRQDADAGLVRRACSRDGMDGKPGRGRAHIA